MTKKYQPLAGRHEDPVATALRIAEEYSSVEHSQSFGDEGNELRRLARAYLAGSLERIPDPLPLNALASAELARLFPAKSREEMNNPVYLYVVRLERLRQALMHRFQFPADNPLAAMYTCPVCGYPELAEPAYDAYDCSSFEICPSCWTEFGYDDFYADRNRADVHLMMRKKWLADGAPWHFGTPPENWDPLDQLRKAGLSLDA